MKNLKYILLLFVAMFSLPVFAQSSDAETLLDKVVAGVKADAPVRMDYLYNVYDDGELLQGDKGVIYIDNERYSLLMQGMKVWCDGATQWSYMREVDEIYVTEASSDEAQNLSPLYVMENYRQGYNASLVAGEAEWVVELHAVDDDVDVSTVKLFVTKDNYRLVRMLIYMSGQGYVDVKLGGYEAKCSVASGAFECPLDEFPGIEVIDMR